MKISKMIEQLDFIKNNYGDIPVEVIFLTPNGMESKETILVPEVIEHRNNSVEAVILAPQSFSVWFDWETFKSKGIQWPEQDLPEN